LPAINRTIQQTDYKLGSKTLRVAKDGNFFMLLWSASSVNAGKQNIYKNEQ